MNDDLLNFSAKTRTVMNMDESEKVSESGYGSVGNRTMKNLACIKSLQWETYAVYMFEDVNAE